MPFPALDPSGEQIVPSREGGKLLRVADLCLPSGTRQLSADPLVRQIAEHIAATRRAGRPVIAMLGPEAITQGLGLVVGELLRLGAVNHVATDGAAAGHDFELGLLGETPAAVGATMAERAGAQFHAAIRAGARDDLGWGEALGRFLAAGEHCPGREASVAYRALILGVPLTVHATIGADAFCTHPACDFGALGWACGQDLRILCASVAGLTDGLLLDLGAGPGLRAVFQGALAAARSQGCTVTGLTTVTLVSRPAADKECPPWAVAGRECRVAGAAIDTLPALQGALAATLGETLTRPPRPSEAPNLEGLLEVVAARSRAAAGVLRDMVARHPDLGDPAANLARAYLAIAQSLAHGGTLFLCGNGGSYADALHISGELLKSYAHPRPLPAGLRAHLAQERNGEALAANLERGLRAVVLGANGALASAVNNDLAARDLSYAQELGALARPGDVLLGISTSGKAANVGSAAGVARALGLTTIGLTGPSGGPLAAQVDVPIRAPGARTDRIQEQHVVLYHTLCEMLEVDLCGEA